MSSRMTRRQVLSYAAFAASAGLLAACQPKVIKETVVVEKKVEVPKEVTKVVEKQVEKIVQQTVVVEKAAKTTKIVFWPRNATDEDCFTRMLPISREMFPEIDLVFETPAGNLYEKMRVAITGGVGPDSIVINAPSGVPFMGEGLLLPLTPYLDKAGEVKDSLEKSFAPAAVKTYTLEGKLYAIPVTSESQVIWYNVDAMKEAGLTPPREIEDDPKKWTWDTLIEYSQKLTSGKGRDRKRFGIHSWNIQSGYGNYLYALGGRFFSEDGKNWTLGSKEGEQAIQFVKDMIFKWDVHPTADTISDYAMVRTMFQNGGLGIMTQGEYFRRYLWGNSAPKEGVKIKYDLARWPFAANGKRTIVYHCLAVPILKNTKQPEATWKWLQVVATQKAQQIITNNWGSRGADQRTYKPWLDANAGNGPAGLNYSAITRGDQDAAPYPVSPYIEYAPLGEIEQRIVTEQIFMNKIGIREGLDLMEKEMKAKIEQAIREAGTKK